MVDCNIVGCNWIELPAANWTIRKSNLNWPTSSNLTYSTLCQIEVDISWQHLISHPPEGEWSKVAPCRILSFDIECAGRAGNESNIVGLNVSIF